MQKYKKLNFNNFQKFYSSHSPRENGIACIFQSEFGRYRDKNGMCRIPRNFSIPCSKVEDLKTIVEFMLFCELKIRKLKPIISTDPQHQGWAVVEIEIAV